MRFVAGRSSSNAAIRKLRSDRQGLSAPAARGKDPVPWQNRFAVLLQRAARWSEAALMNAPGLGPTNTLSGLSPAALQKLMGQGVDGALLTLVTGCRRESGGEPPALQTLREVRAPRLRGRASVWSACASAPLCGRDSVSGPRKPRRGGGDWRLASATVR
jgi:hypothetical protein